MVVAGAMRGAFFYLSAKFLWFICQYAPQNNHISVVHIDICKHGHPCVVAYPAWAPPYSVAHGTICATESQYSVAYFGFVRH